MESSLVRRPFLTSLFLWATFRDETMKSSEARNLLLVFQQARQPVHHVQ